MQVAELDTKTKSIVPTVLVVDDEADMLDLFRDVVAPGIRCKLQFARSMDEARRILARQPVELLIADIHLPDGNGIELLEDLKLTSPLAGAVLMTARPAVEHTISALRHGVLDYLPKPFTAAKIQEQVQSALYRQSMLARNERRLTRLRSAIREMNKARHTVSQKVDLLCNDLVNAYGDVASQMQDLRVSESFRKTIATSKDLEQMLCHAMDWLLKEAGYCNIAIWLAGDENVFELGAYMKYTVVGDKKVTGALHASMLDPTLREGFLHLSDQEFNQLLQPEQRKLLPAQTIMSASCTYLGESLGTIMLFRDGKCPFKDEDATMLRSAASIFATALTTIVRARESTQEDDHDAPPGGDIWEADEPQKPGKKKQPKSDADWWKRGEPPPF